MAEEKSEAATPRRLQKAREEGRVPVSRELSMFVSLSVGLIALSSEINGPAIAHWLTVSLQRTRYNAGETWHMIGSIALAALLPVAAATAAAYIAAALAQTSFLLHPASIQPDLSRISPLKGLKRLFSPHLLVQTAKALVKFTLLAVLLWLAIKRLMPVLPASPYYQPETLYHLATAQGGHLVLWLLGVQAAIAGADYFWERSQHNRQLRMSFQEVRDEHKETDGDPKVKQRLRGLMRARAKRRMMQAVPKAAVVITNPTHYAVALAYERGTQGAPRLVAKGADEVAARIRDLAREHRIPIIANPPLARALYQVEIDTEIPPEHFKAVAEIIAFVWRMRAKAMRR